MQNHGNDGRNKRDSASIGSLKEFHHARYCQDWKVVTMDRYFQ
jgi:hypothetical protein